MIISVEWIVVSILNYDIIDCQNIVHTNISFMAQPLVKINHNFHKLFPLSKGSE